MKKKNTPKTPQFVYNVLRIQVLSQTDAWRNLFLSYAFLKIWNKSQPFIDNLYVNYCLQLGTSATANMANSNGTFDLGKEEMDNEVYLFHDAQGHPENSSCIVLALVPESVQDD